MRVLTESSFLRYVPLLLGLSFPLSVAGAVVTYSGTFDAFNPNEVFMVPLVLTTSTDVTIQTYSYGGGATHDGIFVPSGSFDPTVTLFAGSGPGAIFRDAKFFNDDGTCPPANADPGTLLCLDSVLNLDALDAGTYTIVLTVAGNAPVAVNLGSGLLGDGFEGSGLFDEPPVTRYVLDVVTTTVPEPQTIILVGLASVALCFKISRLPEKR
jgi:hypothetical protein